ncbi:hypothetical protein NLG97_g4048 [Lecanicillium saksenae]|uniref:Uncharacterized protein n=1 Tax=Lecanicillium saksenae TaxID=468837 RepID=A0ACC1QWE1_9HYPO|nr:hypothetical protein NLG97_g4048 [Lecanicillium saksenae]
MLAEQRQQRGIQEGTQLYPFAPVTSESPSSPASRNFKSKGISQYEGGAGKMISRPTPMPQYPAPETPTPTGNTTYPSSYRPPLNRPSQAPQRPPRPSRIPSMVDQARLQEPTPLFIAPVRTAKSTQESTYSQASPTSQYSSVQYPPNAGYITELPSTSAMNQQNQQKKGAILGPPPSSRRGASSFYSNASFVSPIIEESPQSRSHGSYASSAAMPENWSSVAENNRHAQADTFYEESITDISPESIYDEYGDERRLVQPVELDTTPTATLPTAQQERFDANRTPNLPANGRRASWNALALGAARRMSGQRLEEFGDEPEKGEIIYTDATATSGAPAGVHMAQNSSTSRPRNSLTNRGLRIDMDAVREAEQRGSLTSLPDLIRRATRLAAMIDKGRRPTSRLGNLNDYLDEKQLNADRRGDARGGRPPSGLSDMLAAFPPPVSTPQLNNGPNRSSWLGQGGWPLKSGAKGSSEAKKRSKRRCCGLPLWAAVLATVLLLCIIVAAIVVPLELFVFNKNSSPSDSSGIDKCRKDVTCLNGGTNVVSRGTCSCICSGGFTGPDCGTAGSVGCTTTDLVSIDKTSSIRNVTLGQSIPRIIQEANSNFSVPLSGTSILAKINASGLSCIAQNSLVTFNGRSSRATSEKQTIARARRAPRQGHTDLAAQVANENFGSDVTLSNPRLASPETNAAERHARTDDKQPFNATEAVVDFCRVSVLFVLQEQGVNNAQDAQSYIQAFLTKLGASDSGNGAKITQKEASNVTISNRASINLVDFSIDAGSGLVGGKGAKAG